MRRLVPLLLVLATSTASADGLYFTEGFGGTDVKDELSSYMDNAMRIRLSAGVRRRNWAIEAWFAGALNTSTGSYDHNEYYEDGTYYYDSSSNLTTYGLDLKFLQPVSKHVDVYLRGSMSKGHADGELDGYSGRGLGVGAGIQLKGKVAAIGLLFWPLFFTNLGPKITGALWADTGYEFYRLHGARRPVRRERGSVDAQLNHLTLGFALGSDF